MSIFQGLLPNNTVNRQMKEECTRPWDCLQKTSGLPLNAETIKKAHKMMGKGEEYRKSPVFVGYRISPPADTIGRLVDDALHRYYHPTSSDPILAAADLSIDLTNIHPFEDGNGRLCRMILSHVLIQDGYCGPFTVLLSSFNKKGRRHYIQAIKRYRENLSMFYTIIVEKGL